MSTTQTLSGPLVRLKIDRLITSLVGAEIDARDLAQHLSDPGVTDEVPEANTQLMLSVRAIEEAQDRLDRAMRLLCK